MDRRMDGAWWALTLGMLALGLVVGSIAAWSFVLEPRCAVCRVVKKPDPGE